MTSVTNVVTNSVLNRGIIAVDIENIEVNHKKNVELSIWR